ncbi:MarR family winged helix-turn-helix transcriptional regulator [Arthrobacter sp. 35W]|uniref:MarR family winged helix-turn-helix transcriptional regulator n=1 Tax=Arthrobacter sp. 35W TaxID=1132441 RepID=UPI00047A0AB1|nr:MarR family transcriptional regulator [Arthrobacter sp. 35W]
MTEQPHTAGDADLGELFHAAFRGLRRTWAEQLAPWGLTPHQWRALATLERGGPPAERGGGPGGDGGAGGPCPTEAPPSGLRVKDLAERLRIAPRSATEVVDQLEAKGLLARTPDPADRRATLVAATEAGRALFDDVGSARRGKATEYFSRLPESDRAELARILAALAAPEGSAA